MSCTSHKASLFFGVRGAIHVYELNNLEEYVYLRPLKTRLFKKYLSAGTILCFKIVLPVMCNSGERWVLCAQHSVIVSVHKPATPSTIGIK